MFVASDWRNRTIQQRPQVYRRLDRCMEVLCYLSLAAGIALVVASVAIIAVFSCTQPMAGTADAATAGDLHIVAPVAEGDHGGYEVLQMGMSPKDVCSHIGVPTASGYAESDGSSNDIGTPGTTKIVKDPEVSPDAGTPTGASSVDIDAKARESVVSKGLYLAESFILGNVETIVPEPAAPLKAFTYKVTEGDSLSEVARKFGITPETVLWANDIRNPELLFVGQELKILPVPGVLYRAARGDTVAAIATMFGADEQKIRKANGLAGLGEPREGDELIVPGGMMMTQDLFEAPPSSPPPIDVLAAAPRHTVMPGDTLVSIADAYGVLPSAIQAANNLMDPDLVKIGQVLIVPGGKKSDGAVVHSSPTPSLPTMKPTSTMAIPAPTQPRTPPGQASAEVRGDGVRYTVKKGDTLYSIARAFGVTPSDLALANGISDPNTLVVGRVLVISGSRTIPTPVESAIALKPIQSTAAPVPLQPTPTPTPKRPEATPIPAPTSTGGKPSATGSVGDRIAALAQKYVGFRYVWGGHSPDGFDCTGFTWYVYREAGITIPMHDLGSQLGRGQKVPKDKLLPGDLVFFQNTYMKGLSHVGIYLGSGRFINAETEKTGVQVRAMADSYWSSRYVDASRPW